MELNNNENFLRFLLGFVVFIVFIIFFINFSPASNKIETESINSDKAQEQSSSENWKTYQHNTLGIEFRYPPNWGEIKIIPGPVITDLKTIAQDFMNFHESVHHKIEIRFSKFDNLVLRFMDSTYLGELYPNSYAQSYGSIENIEELKATNNICKYKKYFSHPEFFGKIEEVYSSCNDEIKTALVQNSQIISDSIYFNYSYYQAAYKKLQNSYFDNLLIKRDVYLIQSKTRILGYEDLKNNQNLLKLQESSQDIKKVIDSIKIFTPPQPTKPLLEIKPNEDSNIVTIKKYYNYLTIGDLNNAYNMYITKNISFNQFQEWYQKVSSAVPFEFKKINTDTYKFDVHINDRNSPQKKYRVVMKVIDDKINTLSSEEITSDEIRFKNLTAYTRIKLNRNEVVLFNGDKELVIASGSNNRQQPISVSSFNNLNFSPKGNFLTYGNIGWEYYTVNVYNINSAVNMDIELPAATTFFTSDEKYFTACGDSDMGGEKYVYIYSLPKFNLKDDLLKDNTPDDHFTIDCNFMVDQSKLQVKLTTDDKSEKILNYDYNLGQLIQ